MKRDCPGYLKPRSVRIGDLTKSQISNWKHALLLAIILLEDHIHVPDKFRGFDLSPRTISLKKRLRATRAGRNANQSESLDFEVFSQNMADDRFEILTDINTNVTDVITFGGNMKWDSRYCQFSETSRKTSEI